MSLEPITDNNHGKSFPKPMRFMGCILIPVGIFFTFLTPIVGVIILLLTGFVCFSSTGTKIDFGKKKFMVYNRFFGIKFGKWNSLEGYPYVVIRSESTGYFANSSYFNSMKNVEEVTFIYLADEQHQPKVRLRQVIDTEKGENELEEYAEALNLRMIKYRKVPIKAMRVKKN